MSCGPHGAWTLRCNSTWRHPRSSFFSDACGAGFLPILGCVGLILACPWLTRFWPPTLFQYLGCFAAGIFAHLLSWRPGSSLSKWFLRLFAFALTGYAIAHALGELCRGSQTKPLHGFAVSSIEIAVVLIAIPAAAASVQKASTPFDRHLGNLAYPLS